ncbi:MAG: prepilin-type N-terminal cleavage/methylation domain-containing protein, partial [Ruminiclostridium sp.]|nr:prepilin-type N-terminal cleavage/methylation domain-containing protein [Ruminiclostridium sp.]
MKKRFKRILNKKGVTLVELIVVLLVSSILLGIAIGMLKPVTRLLNSVKGNAHMDTTSNAVNEYIRDSLQTATSVCIIPYSKLDSVRNQWAEYTKSYNHSNGYKVMALGVMENYNGDFRLYDFGDVTTIDYAWGSTLHLNSATESEPGHTFELLMNDRDGGGTWQGGLDGHEFHKFDAFNEGFYSNGKQAGGNYGLQVAFTAERDTTTDEDGNVVTTNNINYLTIYTQVFERKGDYKWDKSEGGITYFKDVVELEPANQMKSLSFNMLNGTVTLDQSSNVNKIVEKDGAKVMELAEDPNTAFLTAPGKHKMTQDGLVILYVVRDLDSILSNPFKPTP